MPISNAVADALGGASWIRRMFEQGLRLKQEFGEDAVADLSLGNPVMEPPPEVRERLKALAAEPPAGHHRYMPNAGLGATRQAVAAHLEAETGVLYDADHVVMTVGAGGGLVVTLKAILDPGDEVIVFAPYFVEYTHYVANFGARTVIVPTDAGFRPDPAVLAAAITPRTRAVLLNSPNNPTGVIYGSETLEAVGTVLRDAEREHGRPIYLIADEPYRAISYDGVPVPWPVHHYPRTIHVTSFSKDLALPGERIGYVALNPASDGAAEVVRALVFGMRALGFVSAPALQQRLVSGLLGVRPDLTSYAANRRVLLDALASAGYEVVRPDGAFYVFPRVPGGGDDVAFATACVAERLLVVPGSGFGCPGHFRLSYAVGEATVERASEALVRVQARR